MNNSPERALEQNGRNPGLFTKLAIAAGGLGLIGGAGALIAGAEEGTCDPNIDVCVPGVTQAPDADPVEGNTPSGEEIPVVSTFPEKEADTTTTTVPETTTTTVPETTTTTVPETTTTTVPETTTTTIPRTTTTTIPGTTTTIPETTTTIPETTIPTQTTTPPAFPTA